MNSNICHPFSTCHSCESRNPGDLYRFRVKPGMTERGDEMTERGDEMTERGDGMTEREGQVSAGQKAGQFRQRDDGFTLIELLVVIAIIGVLSGMAAFNFQQARVRTRDVQRKSDLKQLQNALESYKNDQAAAKYPDVLADLAPDFIKKIPTDPKEQKLAGSWIGYNYSKNSVLTYALVACLENTGDKDKDAANNATVCTSGTSYTLTEP